VTCEITKSVLKETNMKTVFLYWIVSFILVIALVPVSMDAAGERPETATFVVG
jgi:hypothetical protein